MERTGAQSDPAQPPPTPDGGNTWALVALILGIVGVVIGLFVSAFNYMLPLVIGVVTVVFGVLGIQRAAGKRGMAIWGTVLGVVTLLLGVAGYVTLQSAFNGLGKLGNPGSGVGGSERPPPAIGKTVSIGEPLAFPGQYTVTVNDVRKSSTLTPTDSYAETVRADGTFYILDLTVQNRKHKSATFDDSLVALVDKDGTVYSANTGGGENQIGTLKNYIDERQIQPKGSERGLLAFDIPREANVVKAQVAETFDFVAADNANLSYVSLDR